MGHFDGLIDTSTALGGMFKDEYCECGNSHDNCTCIKCDICGKDFPLHKLYFENNLNKCELCLSK